MPRAKHARKGDRYQSFRVNILLHRPRPRTESRCLGRLTHKHKQSQTLRAISTGVKSRVATELWFVPAIRPVMCTCARDAALPYRPPRRKPHTGLAKADANRMPSTTAPHTVQSARPIQCQHCQPTRPNPFLNALAMTKSSRTNDMLR